MYAGSTETLSVPAPIVVPSNAGRTVVMPTPSAARFVFIDGLRGVAAFAVMMHHFGGHRALAALANTLPAWVLAAFEYGNLGVPIFFVISGFVIAHSVGRAPITFAYLGNFVLRRSIRLDPPYWATIALVVILAAGKSMFLGHAEPLPSMPSLLAHLTYSFGLFGIEPILPVFWTLCHEVQFYLLYCLLLGASQRWLSGTGRATWVIALTGFASALGLVSVPGLCLQTWYMFALGVLACQTRDSKPARLAFALLWGYAALSLSWAPQSYRAAAVLTAGAVVLAAANGGMSRWLSNRPVQYLGGISYSLYLLHGVLGWLVLSIGADVLHLRSPLTGVALFVAAVLVSLGSAHLMRAWIEVPCIQLTKRLRPTSR